jgi:hypothetical protein
MLHGLLVSTSRQWGLPALTWKCCGNVRGGSCAAGRLRLRSCRTSWAPPPSPRCRSPTRSQYPLLRLVFHGRRCICSNAAHGQLYCRTIGRLTCANVQCGSPACVQILSVTVADEEVTVSYCHNVASQHQNELHFTLAMPSPEVHPLLHHHTRAW